MITKESLISERESVNEAYLKIKQKYSSTSKSIFLIVEGKDDVPFYGLKAENYKRQGFRIQVIPAKNRKKVVEAYQKLDWTVFSKSKVLFVIDRDLSDYTGEDTPQDENIYITDNYSIENDICTKNNYIRVLKYLAQLNDIDESDEAELLSFYNSSEQQFFNIATPIMALILFWNVMGINAIYANVNFSKVFHIHGKSVTLNPAFQNQDEVIKFVFEKSKITYDSSIDLNYYMNLLQKDSPIHYIRGKYLAHFFLSMIKYTVENSKSILPSKKEAKLMLQIGHKDFIATLSGYMEIPHSLHCFLNKIASVQ